MGVVMFVIGAGYSFVAYVIAVILHELAHSEVAAKRGYVLNDIKLMPFGASLSGDFENVKPADELIIALAGPLFSLALAVIFVALWWVVPTTYFFSQMFVTANVFLFAFNMLPIYPLDGGRATLALLSYKMPREKAYRYMRMFGWFFAGLFAVSFFVSFFFVVNFSLGAVSAFIIASTLIPDKSCAYHRIYSQAYRSERLKKGLRLKEIMISSDNTMLEITRMISGNYYHRLNVCDSAMKNVARIEQAEFENLLLSNSPMMTIGKVLGRG
ncbi:MAG: site-2 protease family protein [Firmicutes bacterium]|nr:site-2 protease family protein [Bacillota bacterium]